MRSPVHRWDPRCLTCGHSSGHYHHDGEDGPGPCPSRTRSGACPGHREKCEERSAKRQPRKKSEKS